MVTYDDVKSKIETLRKRILADMTYKRAERAKSLFNTVQLTVKYILEQLAANVSAKADLNVDGYNVQLYLASAANAIGEKKVAVNYADETTEIDGRTVIPFDTFSYDPSQYATNVKSFADALSKQAVLFRIPLSETPPAGDFEDVDYSYYQPETFTQNAELVIDLYSSFLEYGTIPYFAELDLYGLGWAQYDVRKITGSFDEFLRTIDGGVVAVYVGTGGIIEILDPDSGDTRNLAYKYVVYIHNPTSYTVEVLIGNKPHKAPAGKYSVYAYLTDIHLKATPYKIFEYG